MLGLTIAIIGALFILSYVIFDKDLLAPPTAVALTFLFASFCTFYNEERWGLEFSPKSLGLIAAGIIATMIGGYLGVLLSNFPRTGVFALSHDVEKPREIYVSAIKTFVVIAFQIVTMLMVLAHIRRLIGYSSWVLTVTRYRALTGRLADANDASLRIPFLTRNMLQFSRLLGVVYAYIIGNNLVASKKKVSLNWIPPILYSLTTFMQGDRSNMIRLWVVVLVVAYTIHRRAVGWKKTRETRKVIRGMAISIFALGVVFVVVRQFVGRTSTKDPFYYLTFYAGAPIAVLNQVWEAPIVKPAIFGQRIFYYLNQSTTALFGWPGRYNFYYDFMSSPNGTSIGNAPTTFRPAYVEFGPVGFFLFMVAAGAFFTFLYCKCRKKKGTNPIDFRLLIYSFIAYVFLMYFYSTFFDFLTHVFFKYMIELFLIRWALVGWQFKRRVTFTFGKSRTSPVPVERPRGDS